MIEIYTKGHRTAQPIFSPNTTVSVQELRHNPFYAGKGKHWYRLLTGDPQTLVSEGAVSWSRGAPEWETCAVQPPWV